MSDAVVKMGWDNAQARAGAAELTHISKKAKHEHEGVWSHVKEIGGFDELKGIFLGALGGGTVAGGVLGLVEAFHGLTEEYGHLADIAQRFETTPESIQRLQMHAKLAGTDVETLAAAMGKLLLNLEQSDDPAITKAFRELGISAVDLAGIGPERQLELISRAFNRLQEEGKGGEAALKALLGKGYTPLVAAIREYDEVTSKLKNHPTVSNADVALLKEAGDEWERISNAIKVDAAKGFVNVIHEMQRATQESKGKGVWDWLKSFFKEPPGWKEAMAREREENARILAANKHGAPMADAAGALDMFFGPHQDTRGGFLSGLIGRFGPLKEHMAEFSKEWMEKTAVMERENEARATREGKLDEENRKEMLAAQKELDEARQSGGEAALSELEKLVYLQDTLHDKEQEIAAFKTSDEFTEVGLVKLETQRVQLIGKIADQQKRANDEEDQAAEKERDRQLTLAKKLQREAESLQKKQESRRMVDLETALMEAQVHHHAKQVESIQIEMRLREEMAKLKAAGVEDENEQLRIAKQRMNLEAKLHGQKQPFEHRGKPAPVSEAGQSMVVDPDWLFAKRQTVSHDEFYRHFNRGPSALDWLHGGPAPNQAPQAAQAARNGQVKQDHPIRVQHTTLEELMAKNNELLAKLAND